MSVLLFIVVTVGLAACGIAWDLTHPRPSYDRERHDALMREIRRHMPDTRLSPPPD